MVALTGAALLASVSSDTSSGYSGLTGMSAAIGTAERCTRNFNCVDSGQECCNQYGCYCAPKGTGYQYAWNMPGKRYRGQERTCLPMASKPGLFQC